MRSLLLAAALLLAAPTAAAAAAPRISATPATVDRNAEQTVTGRGWPVFETCPRSVRVRVVSDQNLVTLGHARVRASGRFTFRWTPRDENVGAGRWRLVVRMLCESGDDGSPVPVRRTAAIRVRR